jgi:hypothetical protein
VKLGARFLQPDFFVIGRKVRPPSASDVAVPLVDVAIVNWDLTKLMRPFVSLFVGHQRTVKF